MQEMAESREDMFLDVEGVTGEAHDSKYAGKIDVIAWSWGMRAQTGAGSAGDSAKTTLNELEVRKRVDKASTALMSLMRNNAPISKATLTVRKAGGNQLEYFSVKIEDGRITSYDVHSNGPELMERLTIAFRKIIVQYTPQHHTGQGTGASTFGTTVDKGR